MPDTDTTTTTAVTFDVAAFRTWLDTAEHTDGEPIHQSHPYLGAGFDHIDGEPGWLTSTALDCAWRSSGGGWRAAEGVAVRAYPVAGAEGEDIGVVAEVLADGQWLSVGHLDGRTLIPVAEDQRIPGYEAAILALETLAARVNERVEHYRSHLAH